MRSHVSLSILIVMVVILVGKIIAFSRSVLVSYYFGATKISDAYFAAYNIPGVIYFAFITSYLVLIIPEYDKVRTKFGLIDANKFLSKYLIFVVMVSSFLSLACYLYIDVLIKIIAPQFDEETKELAYSLGGVLVLSFPFTAICLSLAAISTAHNKFYAQHIIPILSGIIIISSLYFFAENYGIYALAIAGVLANVFQTLVQVFISRSYFKFSFHIKIFDENMKNMSILVLPIFIGYSVEQVNMLVNSIIASGLAEGSLSSLHYAQNIQLTILGTVTTAIVTVLYPKMSKLSSEKEDAKVVLQAWSGVKFLFLILTPVITYLAFNLDDLIRIIYVRGEFDEVALGQTSDVLFFYLFNIFFLSLREFVIRFYYLSGRTTLPMLSGVFSVIINIILSYILVSGLGVAGLSLANLIATFLSVMLLVSVLFYNKELLNISNEVKVFFLKIGFSLIFVSIGNEFFNNYIISKNAFSFIGYFFINVIVFYFSLLLVKQKEAIQVFLLIKNRFNIHACK